MKQEIGRVNGKAKSGIEMTVIHHYEGARKCLGMNGLKAGSKSSLRIPGWDHDCDIGSYISRFHTSP